MNTELYHENLEDIYNKFGRNNSTTSLAKTAEWLGVEPEELKKVKDLTITVGKRYKVPYRNLARFLACGR